MNYFDFLYNVVGYEAISRGRCYPPYYLEVIDRDEIEDGFIHTFGVLPIRRGNQEIVKVRNNGSLIFQVECSCDNYKKMRTCEHIAACLLIYRARIVMSEKIDVYKESQDILEKFYQKTDKPIIKQKANLSLDILFYDNEINFKLSVGLNKLYVLNTKTKFDNFKKAFFNGGEFALGTKFVYDKQKYYFEEEDTKLIKYLTSFERDDYNSYANFRLFERDFEYLIEHVDKNKFKINGNQIYDIVKDLPSNFKLIQNKDKDYELKFDFKDDYDVLLPDYKYIYYKNILYVIPDNYAKILVEFDNHDIDTLLFKKSDLEKFNRGVLKNIQEKVDIDEAIDEIKVNLKPVGELYFDIGNVLTCQVKMVYGDNKFDIFEDKENIIRDYSYEEELWQDLVNMGFEINNKKIKMEDIDNIGYFLEEGINILNQKYTIFTSKKMQNTSLIKKSRVMKNFSIGTSGIMAFDFEIDNIDMNELKGIFQALKSKKTYHKLKNGNIINLETNEDLQNLEKLADDLDLDYNNLEGSIEIPKYRALYIDSLKDTYKDIQTNNLFDEFINNFKAYQNVEVKLSKEDNKILRDYQKMGVRWLYTIYKCDLGGILADEMGLGKSIQTICFLKEVLKNKKEAKILIVCPTSLVYNWQREFEKFGSNLKYKVVGEAKSKRIDIINDKKTNIFITSYGLLRNDLEIYKEKDFEVCVIDEAQYIKNYQAQMTKALKQIKARTKIALTGTPLENSVTELWSIFDFLMPGYLNSVQKFQTKYHISDVKEEDLKKLESLNKQIKPFILRRKKNDVTKDLPDKIENNIFLEFGDEQKKLYLSVLKETQREIDETIEQEGFTKARFKILTLLMRLRQICIEPKVLYENYQGEAIKIEKLIEMIKDYAKEQHKILIFSSFKQILDLVKIRLEKENISFYSIDGSVAGKDRLPLVEKFNNDKTTCFLITLKAGGTGLNLTSADVVIHLDIWWNPQVENQATDRTHRIGQTKKVIVNKLITKGTIEERILELQNKKKILSENLIEGNTSKDMLGSLSEEELKSLLTYNQD